MKIDQAGRCCPKYLETDNVHCRLPPNSHPRHSRPVVAPRLLGQIVSARTPGRVARQGEPNGIHTSLQTGF
jgi:hypothetical protein